MLDYAWVIPVIPAVSYALILFFGKRMPKKGSELGILAVGSSFVLACWTAVAWIQRVESSEAHPSAIVHSTTWFTSGIIKLSVGIQIDGLAVMMLFVVTLISLLVHVYSTAYMKGDVRYTHYYAALSLFTASMLLLVVADNTLMLMVGWELVGLCSFMLIGHWWEEQPNTNAALKAFFTTRTGDIGLLIGVILTGFLVQAVTGTFSFGIQQVNAAALSPEASHTLVLVCASALFIGVIGKSGQFPLHTWLPDAMAGPTPVSALIHAATMVVAGVYLLARIYGVFWSGFNIENGGMNAIAIIGAITIVIGALLAFVQSDIKKVLAYSTISQLGYMVLAMGVGAWLPALFHLFTHAFFKALLFLGAGSVSHSGSHHSFDMKKDMGGLRKYMPQTFWTFMIGTAALIGIFPFAGFFSKDEILATAGQGGYEMFMIVGLVGAFLTAAYMTRCVYLTFFGEYRGHHHPHESEKAITIPLWILAFFSVFAGWLQATFIHFEKFGDWIEPLSEVDLNGKMVAAFPELVHPHFELWLPAVALVVGATAIGLMYLYYWRNLGPHGLTQRNAVARAGYTFLENKYYLDALYTGVIVGGIKGPIARLSYWINQNVIDAVPNGVGKASVALGRFAYDVVDQEGVDGVVNGLATGAGGFGGVLRRLQTGRVQWYALMLFFAVGLISLAVALYG
ncbi:MAG: NADH-quinone oxidoreductase subunit L [Acidimicrobiia bacterium]